MPQPKKNRWKKNLRLVPDNIINQINHFKGNTFFVGCVKKLMIEDIQAGIYAHIGITFSEGQTTYASPVLPLIETGYFSTRNRVIFEHIHKDEPKTEKSWSIETPNYGDWSKGTHEIVFTREVYKRTYEPPKGLYLLIENIGEDVRDQSQIFRFTVDEILDRTIPSFLDDLFFNLNLLQENVGNHNVFETGATRDDFLRSLYVNWEILPPGERDETLTRILSGVRSTNPRIRAQIAERYDFLRTLKPVNFIRGTNGFRNYFGAMFAEDLVVFENLDYGNAIYVMYENWQTLSQKSRIDLLKLTNGDEFLRIRHSKNWKRRLRAEIISRR